MPAFPIGKRGTATADTDPKAGPGTATAISSVAGSTPTKSKKLKPKGSASLRGLQIARSRINPDKNQGQARAADALERAMKRKSTGKLGAIRGRKQ